MTGPVDLEKTSQNEQNAVLSVEQLNLTIKRLLEGEIATVWVQGEISNFKAHTSGHYYFSLKDSKSQISAVMFRGHNSKLKFKPSDGTEVIVRGRISVYEPRGSYQILCEMMEPVGAGALQKAFEQLKTQLKLEGLFDSQRKKQIPAFPKHIAIVTSPTGAAIRDILNILSRRAPHVEVTIIPALVQGDAAAVSLQESFQKALRLKNLDAIIIGRGGGSIEDMWCFNNEKLARMISNSSVPVISAVGHEIDFTICDFVADLRAPTPSAAAELVAKSHDEVLSKIQNLYRTLVISTSRKIRMIHDQVTQFKRLLVDPKKRVQDLILRNDDLMNRLSLAMESGLKDKKFEIQINYQKLKSPDKVLQEKSSELELFNLRLWQGWKTRAQKNQYLLQQQMKVLNSLSPLEVVERGYSIALKNDQVITNVDVLKIGDEIKLGFARGQAELIVKKISKESLWTSKKN